MDKLLKRGLRQLRLVYRISDDKRKLIEPINREEIRKKVLSLHEFEEDLEEWGVGSKFQMEAFQLETSKTESKNIAFVNDLKIESIIKFISDSSAVDDLKLYQPIQDDPEKVTQIVLSLPSTPARRALLQSVLTAFKPLFPKRNIAVDGESDKKADWIVIDLKTVLIHIFDPQTRLEVDLDGKLEKELGTLPDESLTTFIKNLSNSLPRSIASRPNFIEKFLKNKQI